jgi:uncharacterized membrane protein
MKHWTRVDKLFLACFLAWSFAGVVLTPLRLGPEVVASWDLPGWLRGFIILCLQWGDPLLMFLAAANTHLITTRQWGVPVARRWGAAAIAVGAAVETVGTLTGFPFGSYEYTDAFGPRLLGVLPVTIPLAWFVVATNFLLLVRMVAPYASAWQEAAAVGLLATLFDAMLEPFAVEVRRYWIWMADGAETTVVPWTNYLAWWATAGLLVRGAAPTSALRYEPEWRPAIILAAFVILFGVARLAYGV